MKTITDILFKQTTLLKEEFLTKTKEWAIGTHKRILKRINWKEEDWCECLGIEPESKISCGTEYKGFPKGFYNTRYAKEYRKLKTEVDKMRNVSIEKYVETELKKAELHYNTSIEKLALRITEKNLNIENLKVKTGRVGVNIETTLTDDIKTVKAFTVVASGLVQRPHYRYLVK